MSAVGGEFATADTDPGADVMHQSDLHRRVEKIEDALHDRVDGVVPMLKGVREAVEWIKDHRVLPAWYPATMTVIAVLAWLTLVYMAVKNG